MKAIVQDRYGSLDHLELREVEVPPLADDEVRVRVRAASVHADVWHVVVGQPWVLRIMGGGLRRPKQPIPGTDMAGVVESVGSDVTRFRPGDEVFGETVPGHQWMHGGAWAEYVTARPEWLAPKPAAISFEEAASVATSGHIALLNLRSGRILRRGQTVLVNGAGGGVGALALQIAKAHGAVVTGVDGPGKLDLLRKLGADDVLDYTREDFTRGGRRWDLIFDVPGNHALSACLRALEPEGKYVLIGHEGYDAGTRRALGLFPTFIGLILRSLFDPRLRLGREGIPEREDSMALLARHLEAGEITPVVDSVWPLAEAPEALRHLVENETRGKVILTV